jgi:hypothetical protein
MEQRNLSVDCAFESRRCQGIEVAEPQCWPPPAPVRSLVASANFAKYCSWLPRNRSWSSSTEVASITARARDTDSTPDEAREPLERGGSAQIGELERTPDTVRRADLWGVGNSAASSAASPRTFRTAVRSAAEGDTDRGLRASLRGILVVPERPVNSDEIRSRRSGLSTDEAKGNTELVEPAQCSTRADESTERACDSAARYRSTASR